MDKIPLSHTSFFLSVSIDVEPKRVEHTSPERLDEVENKFIKRYPNAREPTDIIAMAASPFIFVFCPVFKSSTAHIIVTGSTSTVAFASFNTPATATAPNATWDKPSPIKENLFSTNVTPSKEEQSAINTPTISAYLTKGYSIYRLNFSNIAIILLLFLQKISFLNYFEDIPPLFQKTIFYPHAKYGWHISAPPLYHEKSL